MKTVLKTVIWPSLVIAGAVTAFGQVAVDTNSGTTNFGGSRPAGSGIKPSRPDEGGTAWMANTNRNFESNNASSVGGTSPGTTADSTGRARSTSLNDLGWLGLLGLAGLLGLVIRQFEPRDAD